MLRYKRSERVKELLREEISLYVQNIQDSNLGFVTVTEIKLSDDLSHAKMYYSVIGEEDQKKTTRTILQDHIHPLRKLLGKKLSLRRIPEIKLIEDETTEKASRIFTLLESIRSENESSTPPEKTNNETSSE